MLKVLKSIGVAILGLLSGILLSPFLFIYYTLDLIVSGIQDVWSDYE